MAEIQIEKNAKEWVGVQVTERDDGNVTATGVFEVFNSSGTSAQAESAATITGSGTAKLYAEGIVDTTASGFSADGAYEVRFKVTIGNAIYIVRRHFKCVEKRI